MIDDKVLVSRGVLELWLKLLAPSNEAPDICHNSWDQWELDCAEQVEVIHQLLARPSDGALTNGWTCFHCAEHFADEQSATLHFGSSERQRPACSIDIVEYRGMESRIQLSSDEDTELHRQIHRMAGEHRLALQRAEEAGYAKGLKDGDLTNEGAEPGLYWVTEPGNGLVRCVNDARYRKFGPSIKPRYTPVFVIAPPQPCTCPSGDGSLRWPCPVHPPEVKAFQARVQPWMTACFGEVIASDRQERNHRFLEEALELVQACGATIGEAHQLVDYVYGRAVGEPAQEVGGVMVTLAALCLAQRMDMHQAAEVELTRVWTKVEQIRAKQLAKPAIGPLPGAYPDRQP